MFIPLKTALFYWVKMMFFPALRLGQRLASQAVAHKTKAGVPGRSPKGVGWCPRPELNWDQRFRKPLLYPFELRGQAVTRENTPPAANGKRNAILKILISTVIIIPSSFDHDYDYELRLRRGFAFRFALRKKSA